MSSAPNPPSPANSGTTSSGGQTQGRARSLLGLPSPPPLNPNTTHAPDEYISALAASASRQINSTDSGNTNEMRRPNTPNRFATPETNSAPTHAPGLAQLGIDMTGVPACWTSTVKLRADDMWQSIAELQNAQLAARYLQLTGRSTDIYNDQLASAARQELFHQFLAFRGGISWMDVVQAFFPSLSEAPHQQQLEATRRVVTGVWLLPTGAPRRPDTPDTPIFDRIACMTSNALGLVNKALGLPIHPKFGRHLVSSSLGDLADRIVQEEAATLRGMPRASALASIQAQIGSWTPITDRNKRPRSGAGEEQTQHPKAARGSDPTAASAAALTHGHILLASEGARLIAALPTDQSDPSALVRLTAAASSPLHASLRQSILLLVQQLYIQPMATVKAGQGEYSADTAPSHRHGRTAEITRLQGSLSAWRLQASTGAVPAIQKSVADEALCNVLDHDWVLHFTQHEAPPREFPSVPIKAPIIDSQEPYGRYPVGQLWPEGTDIWLAAFAPLLALTGKNLSLERDNAASMPEHAVHLDAESISTALASGIMHIAAIIPALDTNNRVRSLALALRMALSFWATAGTAEWCLRGTGDVFTEAAPLGQQPLKQSALEADVWGVWMGSLVNRGTLRHGLTAAELSLATTRALHTHASSVRPPNPPPTNLHAPLKFCSYCEEAGQPHNHDLHRCLKLSREAQKLQNAQGRAPATTLIARYVTRQHGHKRQSKEAVKAHTTSYCVAALLGQPQGPTQNYGPQTSSAPLADMPAAPSS